MARMPKKEKGRCRWGSHVGPWTQIWWDKVRHGKTFDVIKCQHCGKTKDVNIRRLRRRGSD